MAEIDLGRSAGWKTAGRGRAGALESDTRADREDELATGVDEEVRWGRRAGRRGRWERADWTGGGRRVQDAIGLYLFVCLCWVVCGWVVCESDDHHISLSLSMVGGYIY